MFWIIARISFEANKNVWQRVAHLATIFANDFFHISLIAAYDADYFTWLLCITISFRNFHFARNPFGVMIVICDCACNAFVFCHSLTLIIHSFTPKKFVYDTKRKPSTKTLIVQPTSDFRWILLEIDVFRRNVSRVEWHEEWGQHRKSHKVSDTDERGDVTEPATHSPE